MFCSVNYNFHYAPCMTARPAVTPNRRGMKSRELVLDAAERVMAELARVVAESGIPMSSVYHYYGSKDGILLAVMERGAERFFADLPDPDQRMAPAARHLTQIVATVVETLERHPRFLRLLIVFALQPPQGESDVDAVVGRVREMALVRLRKQLALAFGDDPRSEAIAQLARFALAAFDGAFIAARTDPDATLEQMLKPLPSALVAVRRELAS
jgi:AcrR family transcriptional regulator